MLFAESTASSMKYSHAKAWLGVRTYAILPDCQLVMLAFLIGTHLIWFLWMVALFMEFLLRHRGMFPLQLLVRHL
jgi:hypothetical protein